jgi:hypothetical protein
VERLKKTAGAAEVPQLFERGNRGTVCGMPIQGVDVGVTDFPSLCSEGSRA